MRTKEFSIWDSLRLNGRGIWKADEKKTIWVGFRPLRRILVTIDTTR